MAYQILQQENLPTIEKVKAVLAKHSWYVNQWQTRLQDVPVAQRDQVLFMQAARGLTIFAPRIGNTTVDRGTTSSGRSSR
jgi:hypothetical protein